MHWTAILLYSLVAGGTLALAIATFIAVRQTRKWNKRSERFRVLPFLHLSFIGISLDGVLYSFRLKNLGWGPAVFTWITARNHKDGKEIEPDDPSYDILLSPEESTSIGYILKKGEIEQLDFRIHCRDVRKEHIEFRYNWTCPPEISINPAYFQPYFEEAIFWKHIGKKGKKVKVQVDRI